MARRRRRIIPAYAGSTLTTHYAGDSLPGSSPHTRGALVLWVFCGVYARIIPAYAGSTRIAYADEPYAEDHPRIRGEHVSMVRRCR